MGSTAGKTYCHACINRSTETDYKQLTSNILDAQRESAALIIQKAYRKFCARKCLKTLSFLKNSRKVHKNDIIQMYPSLRKISNKPDIGKLEEQKEDQDKCLSRSTLFQPERETVLVFGGTDPHAAYGVGRNTGKDIFRYVPDENNWEYVGELPEPRHHHCVQFLKGRVYLVGGADPREEETTDSNFIVGTVWSYDPTTRTWFNECGLLIPRKNFALVICNQNMYAIGGQNEELRTLASVEKFCLTKRCWEEMAPMGFARTGVTCAKYRDSILAAGGLSGSRKNALLDVVENYDPKSDQ